MNRISNIDGCIHPFVSKKFRDWDYKVFLKTKKKIFQTKKKSRNNDVIPSEQEDFHHWGCRGRRERRAVRERSIASHLDPSVGGRTGSLCLFAFFLAKNKRKRFSIPYFSFIFTSPMWNEQCSCHIMGYAVFWSHNICSRVVQSGFETWDRDCGKCCNIIV